MTKKDERLIPYLNRDEHLFSMLQTQREVPCQRDGPPESGHVLQGHEPCNQQQSCNASSAQSTQEVNTAEYDQRSST